MWDPWQITYPLLKEVGKGIRVHGNGFIQIDMGYCQRVHVWGFEEIPRQQVSTQIHNHRFDFKSTLLSGRLENRRYSVFRVLTHDPGYYHLYYASATKGEETKLVRSEGGEIVHPVCDDTQILYPSMTYRMDHLEYHESVPHELSMTLITKTAVYGPAQPGVLVPIGSEPGNDFKRSGRDEDELWAIVKQACEKVPWISGRRSKWDV